MHILIYRNVNNVASSIVFPILKDASNVFTSKTFGVQLCVVFVTDLAFKILTWLGYSNSAFNPIIYSIFNTEFREAFKKILTSRYPPCCGYQTVRANTPTRNDNFVTDYGTKTLVVRRSGSLGLSGVDPTPRSSAESVKPLRDYHI